MSEKYWAIIAAAGIGSRMGANFPKQYLKIGNKTILEHTLTPFLTHAHISKVIISLHRDDQYWQGLSINPKERFHTVVGGETRAHSVWEGLKYLKDYASSSDWVIVHDAVRPLITHSDINLLMKELSQHPVGGIFGLPVTETLKIVQDMKIKQTYPRESVWQAQTPQMFRYEILHKAVENALMLDIPITDEASAIEQLGYCPMMIPGTARNIKITTESDLLLAKKLLADFKAEVSAYN